MFDRGYKLGKLHFIQRPTEGTALSHKIQSLY